MTSAHHTALLQRARCPACAEPLSARALFGRAPCSSCGIDTRAFGVSDAPGRFEQRADRTVWVVALVAAVAELLLGWIPFADLLVAVAIAAWIRFAVLRPAAAMLSPGRRLVTRITARLLVAAMLAALLVVSQLLTFLGPLSLPIKAVLGAGEVAVGAMLVTRYTAAQIQREAAGKPVEGAEIGLLIGMGLIMFVAAVAAAYAAMTLLSAAEAFFGGLL